MGVVARTAAEMPGMQVCAAKILLAAHLRCSSHPILPSPALPYTQHPNAPILCIAISILLSLHQLTGADDQKTPADWDAAAGWEAQLGIAGGTTLSWRIRRDDLEPSVERIPAISTAM